MVLHLSLLQLLAVAAAEGDFAAVPVAAGVAVMLCRCPGLPQCSLLRRPSVWRVECAFGRAAGAGVVESQACGCRGGGDGGDGVGRWCDGSRATTVSGRAALCVRGAGWEGVAPFESL